MSLLAPDINKRKPSVRFEDITPSKQRPEISTQEDDDVRLPQISSVTSPQMSSVNSSTVRSPTKHSTGFGRAKGSVFVPKKRDFFKLAEPDNIIYEQNDQTIKQLYATRIETKLKMSELGIKSPSKGPIKAIKQSIKVVEKLKRQIIKSQKPQDFAALGSEYDEFKPHQKLISDADTIANFNRIRDMKYDLQDEFDDSTIIKNIKNRRVSLFGLAVNQQQAQVAVHSRKAVLQRKGSIIKQRYSFKRSPTSQFVQNGKLQSSQHLLAITKPKDELDEAQKLKMASKLYIPEQKRVLKTLKKGIKMDMQKVKKDEEERKKVKFDLIEQELLEIQKKQEAEEKRKRKERKKKKEQTKVKKLKRRASFSEGQMRFDDGGNLFNPLRERKGISLKDQVTITKMKKNRRYPIPEMLIHVPDNFKIYIDSVLTQAYNSDENREWARYREETDVPQNSQNSIEEMDFESSSGEDVFDMIPQPVSKKEAKTQKKRKEKIVKESLDLHGFNMEMFRAYPHMLKDGDIPCYLLAEHLDEDLSKIKSKVWPTIKKEFKEKTLFPTLEHVQLAYEHYCQEFYAQPLQLAEYYKKGVFTVKNQELADNQIKAICCTLPIVAGLKHVKFQNNKLQDEMMPPILMACFMNPDVKILTFHSNYLRGSGGNTYRELSWLIPDKIQELYLTMSCATADFAEPWVDELTKQQNLQILDLQGIPLGQGYPCKNIGKYLIYSRLLRKLNISQCKISFQGTRYIFDGLTRNQGLQDLNFSQNDMSSSVHEFTIVLAKVLSGMHQEIMHVDVSGCGLKKEEVLFLGICVRNSRSCIAIHMSANNLDYYERIFLRTLVQAEVAYHFRNTAEQIGSIRSQKERSQILELKNHDFDNKDLKDFVKKWNFIDQQRLGVDEEMNKIMKDVDITEIFRELKKGNKSKMESNMILQDLIDKIEKRKIELENMKVEESSKDATKEQFFDLDARGTLDNFAKMGLYADQDKKAPGEVRDMKEAVEREDEDLFLMQNALRIERIKKKMEMDAEKQKRAKSAGEMALMFMGINKIAYDLLLENPMTGYMNDVILTRVLQNDEIEKGRVWKDCSQCYVCEKWDITKIEAGDRDKKMMRVYIQKLDDLHNILKDVVDLQNEKLIQKVPESKVKKMYEEDEQRAEEYARLQEEIEQDNKDKLREEKERMRDDKFKMDDESYVTLETDPADKIYTEQSISSEEWAPNEIDDGNTINPIIVDRYSIQKQMPNLYLADDIKMGEQSEGEQVSQDSADDKFYERLFTPPKIKKQKNTLAAKKEEQQQQQQKSKAKDDENSAKSSFGTDEEVKNDEEVQNVVLQTLQENVNRERSETVKGKGEGKKTKQEEKKDASKKVTPNQAKTPQDNKKYRLVQRTIFFEGNAFVIEEEISIDSDETESLETSDDEFEVDETIKQDYNKRLDDRQTEIPEERKEMILNLQQCMDKNKPNSEINIFGRDQVYIVASFLDWHPVCLSTVWETKKKKSEGIELDAWCEKQKRLKIDMKSKKKEENIVQYIDYVCPGKHFFYFIFKNQYVFLSPKYDIVRFKKTNVFINTIIVKERRRELQKVSLGRILNIAEQVKFNKAKSVFKNFQEDTPDFLMKMLEQDLKYGKLDKLCKTPPDFAALKKVCFEHYLQLKNIFLYIASNSSYPTIGLNDYTSFTNRSKFQDKNVNLACLDRQFIATNVPGKENRYKNGAERELHRYEFLEVNVRLSLSKYKEPKIVPNLHEAFDKIMTEDVTPNNTAVDGYNFREEHMYNLKCDEIFKKNEGAIYKLFESHLNPNKKYITLDECRALLKNSDMNINDFKVSPCYAESMMSRIDTLSDLSSLQQMKYVEFIVFIARVSHEVFKNTKQEDLGLHLKIDKCLKPMLKTIHLDQPFTFKDEEGEDEDGDGAAAAKGSDNDSHSFTDSDEDEKKKRTGSP